MTPMRSPKDVSAESEAQYRRMLETPIPKLVSSLAVPTVIGMLITVAKEDAEKALEILHANDEPGAYILGEIVEGETGVELW